MTQCSCGASLKDNVCQACGRNGPDKQSYAIYINAKSDEERSQAISSLMEETGRSKRSIIASLVKANVYVTTPKVSKVTGAKPETKEAIVARIESLLKIELPGLNKAPKLTLVALLEKLTVRDEHDLRTPRGPLE